jgi:hypothetical protein
MNKSYQINSNYSANLIYYWFGTINVMIRFI